MSLVPISPENDGGKLHEKLATYIFNFCSKYKKSLDVNVAFLSTDIVVALDIYNKKGIEAALAYLDKEMQNLK